MVRFLMARTPILLLSYKSEFQTFILLSICWDCLESASEMTFVTTLDNFLFDWLPDCLSVFLSECLSVCLSIRPSTLTIATLKCVTENKIILKACPWGCMCSDLFYLLSIGVAGMKNHSICMFKNQLLNNNVTINY